MTKLHDGQNGVKTIFIDSHPFAECSNLRCGTECRLSHKSTG